jgi:hypothetical protein
MPTYADVMQALLDYALTVMPASAVSDSRVLKEPEKSLKRALKEP